MSFHANGQRRYGHVPPAQYGPSGAQDPNNTNYGLQRQSSFDNGDDAAFFDPNNGGYQPGPPPVPARTNMPHEDLFLTSPTAPSPGRSSFGSTSPALSGYQHQYQPLAAGSQSPPQQQSYNPQAFARTQSQSQAAPYRPAAFGNTNSYSNHQPYNPANYQTTQASSQVSRQSTISGYNNYTPSHSAASTPQIPQTPTYWHSQQYGAPPVPSRPSTQTGYEQPLASPTYVQPNSAPLPHRQSVYNPPATSNPYPNPYPNNGETYNQDDYQTPVATQAPYANYPTYAPASTSQSRPGFNEEQNSFSNRQKRSSTLSSASAPPLPIPTGPHSAGPDDPRLERHPTLRPLPIAPLDQDAGYDDDDDWGMGSHGREEAVTQDQLFADIGDALHRASSLRQPNGDLLDSELGDLHRFDSRATTIGTAAGVERYASTASTVNPNSHEPMKYETTDEYEDDSESDPEAAAGLLAMQIAEEQDAQRGGTGALSFGAYEGPPSSHRQESQDESSNSDYKNMDLGLAGGGYDARMSYGDDLGGWNTGHSSEMEDQSRPLPSREDLNRSDSYSHTPAAGLGGLTEYEGSLHPFPAFEAARVDTFGTGGLQRPTSHSHRLSFDEGDEQSLHSRLSESRQSERSGSESPSRDDMPELFYHPGTGGFSNLNRPLPAVPPMSENRTPQLLPAGSYRNQHQYSNSYGSTEAARPMYAPSGPDAYPPQNMLSPGGQYVPRSSSLSSHSSTPQTVPPTRSKTDAEERARAQKAANGRQMGLRSGTGVDGYDLGSGTPQSTITLDLPALPAGRRKKFSPSRLSSADFRKCLEPWALSGIALWIREMAGGETGEGESDLRQKTIEEGLIALFTHKVPTMNTADAETLSSKVVKSMFDAGILLPEEEWVKFGQGEISGVLWQLTGSGCYAPKVHEQEIHGRCYSHHCTRTLKKINLQMRTLEPERKLQDWITFFNMSKEQLDGASKKEIERQNNLHEIVMSEDAYMDQLDVLRGLYRDDLATWQPPIIAKAKTAKFISSVFGKVDAVKDVNENHLLAQLKYRQKEQGPWVIGFSDIFREWIRKARTAYIEYAAGFPYAQYLMRREADRNLLFKQFLDQARDNKRSARLDYNTFLKAPITRLQRYGLLLGTVLRNMTQDTEEKAMLITAIEEIKAVTLECDTKVDEQIKKVEMIELQSKLFLRPGMERVELNLDHLGRELLFKGDLQRAGANRFTWLETHAILFDHYLVLAKTVVKGDFVGGRKKEVYDVSKLPIPMQLLVLESTNDDPVVKSSVKGIGAVTTVTKTAPSSAAEARLQRTTTNGIERTNTLEHTNSNNSVPTVSSVTRLNQSNDGDAKSMFPFRVKHLGKTETYTLYAPSAANRQEWCDKILQAKTRHAASLFEQNAEPFRLRVIADSAFAYDVMSVSQRSVVSVEGTPLDRSIREMEKTYGTKPRPGPVCRAQVNCATAFNCYGKSMIAIGTDYGVYTAEASNARGWTRSIQVARVTQIAVLEEFSLCLIIADKSLIAYHLDVIVPVSNFPAPHQDSSRRAPQKLSGTRDVSFFATARMKERTLVFYKKREGLHSTFKVLEPVFQKSNEKKSRLFGKKFGAGTTEFFREFDEFYIPTECYTINLFHTYIAISTLKGFELMTLDKKVPMSIPDLKNPAIGNIAARLAGQKPLGMFRLSDAEFLLCYEECGVYVDKHGDVSRSVIMEFVGKAKSAAMYGAYLVLFDSDFVEVRNAENGRLRQVIAGRDVRCLDYGINPLGAGAASSHISPSGLGNGAEKRVLKLAMAHPEVVGSQIVLEMVLNEGHSE